MTRCASVQERLAEEGVELVTRDAAIREHVTGCPVCGLYLQALEQVDGGLSRLPPLPAPASLLARTARAVTGRPDAAPTSGRTDAGARRLASALAATVILAAGFGLVQSVQEELARELGWADDLHARDSSGGFITGARQYFGEFQAPTAALKAPSQSRVQPQSVEQEPPPPPVYRRESEIATDASSLAMKPAAPAEETPMPAPAARLRSNEGLAANARSAKEQKKRNRQVAGELGNKGSVGGDALDDVFANYVAPQVPAPAKADPDFEARLGSVMREYDQAVERFREDGESKADSPTPPQSIAEVPMAEAPLAEAAPVPEPVLADVRTEDAQRSLRAMPGKAGRVADAKDKLEKNVPAVAGSGLAQASGPREVARRFLAERERLQGLHFQSSSGYWANTYVPGDAAIRLLEARLQRWNRSTLEASIGEARLEAAAQQNWQPFDVPQNAALAAYLHADKRAVEGRSRLRVQVGLQASHKRSGLRPDMNVGVVLDLRRPLDDAAGAKLRALVMALAKARQPGDRFSLTVAGHPGGLLVAPAEFRHGPVRIAMQSLFADSSDTRPPAMDLLAALATATEHVRQGDDASAPLGASLVLLISTAPFNEQRASLESMAHENAIAGIGLSVVAVGDGADLASIDRLVLLGQGHRRVLTAAEGAVQLVDRELHAASRAVARAVRLRIRLAPGVEVIDVLGSKNLSESAAERVREAERSIDQRLARNIGIRADRGEDEEGIQIVIPSFFAGDSHAVLLDVVVPGPGPVADVSVRYKDLVYRRNGVARAQLAVEDGHRGPGPLQHNVLKNQLAHELARSAELAGQQLAAGNHSGAVVTLRSVRDLLIGVRLEIPGWDGDNELRQDVALLEQYLKALGSGYAGASQHRRHLVDSLRYVAFRRLIPPYK